MKVVRIGKGIYDSNVFVIENFGHCVIVDAGVDVETVEKVVGKSIVDAVFLTHGHFDHACFTELYSQKFGCKVYAHENAKIYLENSEKNASGGVFELHDFSKFEFFDNDSQFNFSGMTVEAFVCGGHSLSDVIYKMSDHLFVGDLIIGDSIGRLDFFGGNREKMIESLERILALNFSTLHSGHGADCNKNIADQTAKNWLKWL